MTYLFRKSSADQKQPYCETRGVRAFYEHTTCIASAALPAKYETEYYSVFKAEKYDILAYSLCEIIALFTLAFNMSYYS